ncbi:hypothetical protein GW746_01140 [Candidatus Saccharibacteria bacterium]|nr:hypothetical protein [Candidatus Saccharibacteria bacterium]NCS83004.1 hypothetical protein [Candidatus Saccharibacteria bacterium]
MATFDFSQYFFYKWRYIIGYSVIALLLAAVLLFAGLYVPGGLSSDEMAAVVQSQQLTYSSIGQLSIVNLPYHALQDGILHLLGVSIFTIKLPSLILALFSAIGLIALLRRWFKPNIAVLASLIAISTGQFLYVAQLGTPDILYLFWPVMILLLGTQVTRKKRLRLLWKMLFGITTALSLYTPLGIYMILSIVLTVALHPHLRAVIRRLSPVKVAFTLGASLLLLSPLIIGLVRSPSVALELLGVPQQWPSITENLSLIVNQYFIFWQTDTSTLITPVFGLGSLLLVVLGLYRLIRTFDTTRSYLIVIWILALTPALVLNPTLTSTTFLPTVLLLAAGLTSLISYWYRLFPRNPYARIAGLIPIMVLVIALIGSGLTRYVYGYHYSPQATALFSNDLSLIPSGVEELLVSNDKKPFYQAVSEYDNKFEVVNKPTSEQFVVSRDAKAEFKGYEIVRIITSPRSDAADRFYVYEKQD